MMPRLPRSAVHGAAIPLLMTVLAMVLAACVPQDDTTIAGNEQNDGGISGTGYSSGPVDGFGSIYVNGIRYETADARLYIDGEEWKGDESDALGVGMVVTVAGSWDAEAGTAKTIRYRPLLRGPVAKTTLNGDGLGTLTVLNRTVIIDRGTVFADGTEAGLAGPGDISKKRHAVEVSGYPEGDAIRATRLSVIPPGAESALSGRIRDVDEQNRSLTLEEDGTRTVTFDAGTDRTNLPDEIEEWKGRIAHIRGNHTANGLKATAITGITGLGLEFPADEDGEVEAAGRVTADWDDAARTFGFNGATVYVPESESIFEDNGQAADLETERRMKLEAEYRDGTLTAEEVELLAEPTETAFEGAVESVDPVDPKGRVTRLTLFGVEMAVTPRTRLDLDDGKGSLGRGDCVEVLLRPASDQDNGALALQLEREDKDDGKCGAEIEGTVTSVNGQDVAIAGLRVTGLPETIQKGERLEVEGSWDKDDRIFHATTFEHEGADDEDD